MRSRCRCRSRISARSRLSMSATAAANSSPSARSSGYEGDRRVFSRTWNETLPRDCL